MNEASLVDHEVALQFKQVFKPPRARFFASWTGPEILKQWVIPQNGFRVPNAEIDLRVGGNYRIEMLPPEGVCHTAVGAYGEIEKPGKLVFTGFRKNRPEEGETLVTVEFYGRGNTTEVVPTHTLLQGKMVRDDHITG